VQATRRTVMKGLAAGAAVTAAGGAGAFPRRSAAAAEPLAAPQGTTLDSTVVRGGEVAREGALRPYRRLAAGPGEPHVVREELGARAERGRTRRRQPVLSFAHLTDIHVIDAQSPARVEFLDRYDDDERFATLFSSAYRPHEFLSPQLADSIVAAVRRQGVGPVAGRPLAFGLCTGDNTDNAQLNELQWHLDLMNGTPFAGNSGGERFEGVQDQDAASYDVHYWHPDGTPEGRTDDDARRLYGFPTLPGLLDAAIARFAPTGLGLPWYSCYGNHDGLVQGNFPESFGLTLLAEGPEKIVALPAGTSQGDVVAALESSDPARLQPPSLAFRRSVTPDPARRVISRRESVTEHFTRGGVPLGHGFTQENLAAGTAYYVFDAAPQVRGIVLDSVNPNGESSGSLDTAQFAWLRARLEEVTGPGRDRLVIVFSHHGAGSMTNRIPVVDEPGPRVLGPEVQALLLEFPNVVLWVNGHTHVNSVTARTRPGGGGYWEVATAAHVDFPCQARLVEVLDNRDGTLSVFGTVIDAAAPLRAPDALPADPTTVQLASLARELAANDWQEAGTDRRGSVEDRNVELLVPAPFPLATAPAAASPGQGRAAGGAPVSPAAPAVVTARAVDGRSLAATGGGTALAAGALGLAAAGAVVHRRTAAPQHDPPQG
jgi:metallophosphoesterase (TIGR03767 family)